jgi:succinoglycan biosynthesis transport protein ExoP
MNLDEKKFAAVPALPGRGEDDFMDEEEIDLRQYWRTINKYKWRILGLAFIVSVLAVLAVFAMTPVYRSTATILVESKQAKVVSIEEIYGVDPTLREYFQTQFEILKSRDLARKVIEKLNLAEQPEFKGKEQKPAFNWRNWLPFDLPMEEKHSEPVDPMEQLIDQFAKRLTVSPVRNTQLVSISFDAEDPKLAMQVVNALGEAYIESDLEARLDLTRKAGTWLSSRLDGLKEKLAESEHRLQAFLEKEKLVDVEGVLTVSAKEIEGTTERLVEARKQRAEAESLYRKVISLGDSLVNNVESIPEIFSDPVVQDLKQKEAEAQRAVSELAERYGPEHPKLIAARSQLDTVKTLLRKQVTSVVSGIKNSYEVARANEEAQSRALNANKEDIQSISRKQAKLQELQREVESSRHLYEMFFNRFKETSEAGDLQTANARFIDKASTPLVPIKPKKKLIVSLAFVMSLAVGVVLTFLLDYLDASLSSPQDVEQKLGVAFLGLLPLLGSKGKKEINPAAYLDNTNSNFAESVRTIRTGIMLSTLDKPHKTLLITSSVPGEGKSTMAFNIALAMAQMERVLLIDADMRRPTIMKHCEFPPKTPGLSNALAKTAELQSCIHRYEAGNLDVMPVGLIPPNPLELLASRAFADLMNILETRYDTVVLDSPPLHAVSDAQLLSQYANAVVYVVKAEATSSHVAKEGLKRLQQISAPLVGVVLNQIDMEKAGKYGGYYHGYYYNGYYGSADQAERDSSLQSNGDQGAIIDLSRAKKAKAIRD